jgi:hypothetical protein
MRKIFHILITLFFCFIMMEKTGFSCVYAEQPLKTTVAVYYDKNGNKYVYVKGYTKKDGTSVKGYYRSVPNKDKTDNWSTKGNVNPFTGKKGYAK